MKDEPEINRDTSEETRSKGGAHLFLQLVLKCWQGPENGVEIIPWKIIQVDLKLW